MWVNQSVHMKYNISDGIECSWHLYILAVLHILPETGDSLNVLGLFLDIKCWRQSDINFTTEIWNNLVDIETVLPCVLAHRHSSFPFCNVKSIWCNDILWRKVKREDGEWFSKNVGKVEIRIHWTTRWNLNATWYLQWSRFIKIYFSLNYFSVTPISPVLTLLILRWQNCHKRPKVNCTVSFSIDDHAWSHWWSLEVVKPSFTDTNLMSFVWLH